MKDLKNKVAIVTGSSSGVGAATAKFSNAGCNGLLSTTQILRVRMRLPQIREARCRNSNSQG